MRSLSNLWCLLRSWRNYFILKLYNLVFRNNDRSAETPFASLAKLERLPAAAFPGSTAIFFRPRRGIILKAPVKISEDQVIGKRQNVDSYFSIEEQVLRRLGPHPRIITYSPHPSGLLLVEASHGNLQCYLHEHNASIPFCLRQKWFIQAVESIAFIHSRGVIHSDLRPENFLVHGTAPISFDLWLCDFGGSTCEELALSAKKLPDSGFFNPKLPWEPTFAVDIFSLGSVLYAIVKGYWPFRTGTGPFTSIEEMEEYEASVDACFASGKFPSVEGLFGGDIILGCWDGTFSKASETMAAVNKLEF
ncbi:Protein kinase-like domain protein [Metarhizium brunneum]